MACCVSCLSIAGLYAILRIHPRFLSIRKPSEFEIKSNELSCVNGLSELFPLARPLLSNYLHFNVEACFSAHCSALACLRSISKLPPSFVSFILCDPPLFHSVSQTPFAFIILDSIGVSILLSQIPLHPSILLCLWVYHLHSTLCFNLSLLWGLRVRHSSCIQALPPWGSTLPFMWDPPQFWKWLLLRLLSLLKLSSLQSSHDCNNSLSRRSVLHSLHLHIHFSLRCFWSHCHWHGRHSKASPARPSGSISSLAI